MLIARALRGAGWKAAMCQRAELSVRAAVAVSVFQIHLWEHRDAEEERSFLAVASGTEQQPRRTGVMVKVCC